MILRYNGNQYMIGNINSRMHYQDFFFFPKVQMRMFTPLLLLQILHNCFHTNSNVHSTETHLSPVIWEEFELVNPEEVDRVLVTVNSATCVLDPGPCWLVEAS